MKIEDVVGLQSGVRLKFAEPVTFAMLNRKQVANAGVYRVVQPILQAFLNGGLAVGQSSAW